MFSATLPRGFLGVPYDIVVAFERGEWHELSASIVAGDGSVDALFGYPSCDVVEYAFAIGALIGRYAGPDVGREFPLLALSLEAPSVPLSSSPPDARYPMSLSSCAMASNLQVSLPRVGFGK